jgi:hypothetical protein
LSVCVCVCVIVCFFISFFFSTSSSTNIFHWSNRIEYSISINSFHFPSFLSN